MPTATSVTSYSVPTFTQAKLSHRVIQVSVSVSAYRNLSVNLLRSVYFRLLFIIVCQPSIILIKSAYYHKILEGF